MWDYERYCIVYTPIDILRAFYIWGIGYVGIWMSKWILGTIVLSNNVIYNAVQSVFFRIHMDTPRFKIDSFVALKSSLINAFSPFNIFWIFIIAILFCLGVALLIRKGIVSINKLFFRTPGGISPFY